MKFNVYYEQHGEKQCIGHTVPFNQALGYLFCFGLENITIEDENHAQYDSNHPLLKPIETAITHAENEISCRFGKTPEDYKFSHQAHFAKAAEAITVEQSFMSFAIMLFKNNEWKVSGYCDSMDSARKVAWAPSAFKLQTAIVRLSNPTTVYFWNPIGEFEESISLKPKNTDWHEIAINLVLNSRLNHKYNLLAYHNGNIRVINGFDDYDISIAFMKSFDKFLPYSESCVVYRDLLKQQCYWIQDGELKSLVREDKVNE